MRTFLLILTLVLAGMTAPALDPQGDSGQDLSSNPGAASRSQKTYRELSGDLRQPQTNAVQGSKIATSVQRVAMLGFEGNAGNAAEAALASSLSSLEWVSLVDPSQVHAAVIGFGYKGSINMDLTEARSLAAAVGCDFFITGKAESLTRSERAGERHGEAYTGVMIVDGRSGELAYFDFVTSREATTAEALASMTVRLRSLGGRYVEEMTRFRERFLAQIPTASDAEEMPSEDSPEATGFQPPQFLNRTKPEYPAAADLAGINATVEAEAEFLANGKVGNITIVKWAGFGLDTAAEAAIRALKFKPATRDGKSISVRALIRYNFHQTTQSS